MATIDYRTSKMVKAPISVKAVNDLLGAGSNSVGNLCVSGQINMWAKFKPQNYNSDLPITLAQRALNGFGLTKNTINQLSDIAQCDGAANGWTYAKPTAQTGFRLYDFIDIANPTTVGYKHDAEFCVRGFDVPEKFDKATSDALDLSIMVETPESGELSLTDLGLNNYYLGVIMKLPGNGGYDKKVSDSVVSGGEQTFSIGKKEVGEGVYRFWPALFERQNGSGNIVTIPNTQSSACTIYRSDEGGSEGAGSVEVTIDAVFTSEACTTIKYQIVCVNTGDADVTINVDVNLSTDGGTNYSAIASGITIIVRGNETTYSDEYTKSGSYSGLECMIKAMPHSGSTNFKRIALPVEDYQSTPDEL